MSYLRGSSGYVLVADGTRTRPSKSRVSLHERVKADYGSLPFVLLLNKSDLKEQWSISDAEMASMRGKGWWVHSSSARTGEGVEDAFTDLAARVSG